MFKQFDVVKTIKPVAVPAAGTLKSGSKRTILEIYKSGGTTGYHIEFLDSRGKTKALVILTADQIEPGCTKSDSAKALIQISGERISTRTQESKNTTTPHLTSKAKRAASASVKTKHG